MELSVAYRLGQSKKNKGSIRIIVQAGWTYDVVRRLIAEKLSEKYNYKISPKSIHIRAVDVTIISDHNDYRNGRNHRERPCFRPPFRRQHIPKAAF